MKILFAYFDFKINDSDISSQNIHEECALNFSTEYTFSVTKDISQSTSGKTCQYIISRQHKPESDCLPNGFWGERIYNVTAIVGNNGSGKSTIIHNIIKALNTDLKPSVPFILVLVPTNSNNPYIYCHEKKLVRQGDGVSFPIQDTYPTDLLKAKCMLLDNTLSLSALELDRNYSDLASYHNIQIDSSNISNEYKESNLQLYDRSLIASVRYSNGISRGSLSLNDQSVYDIFYTHFRYESFQEARFLFDRFQRKNLNILKERKYPLPYPNELFVSVERILDSSHDHNDPNIEAPYLLHQLSNYDFVGQIIISMYNNFKILFYEKEPDRPHSYPHSNKEYDSLSFSAIVLRIKEIIAKAQTKAHSQQREKIVIDSLSRYLKFLDYIIHNEKTLSDIFQPYKDRLRDNQYHVNYEQTLSNPEKLECMISFLNVYRPVCFPHYFLIFSSGMSSGEKNLLRMLTQFRYVLSGPPVYSEHDSEENTEDRLINVFLKEGKHVCDTLFLFLDEADLTYHPEWQRRFVSMLTDILPLMFRNPYNHDVHDKTGCRDIQVIISTHSPLMLGDFPKASVNYLKGKDASYTIPDPIHQHSTFGENLYTILKEGFFLDSPLGMFASNKINKAAEWCTKIRNNNFFSEQDKELQKEYKEHYQTAQLLAPGIIKNKLLIELSFCADKLNIRNEEIDPDYLKQHIASLEAELEKARTKLREKEQN